MESISSFWIGPCGIRCHHCSIHLRTSEELEYWNTQKVDLDTIRCDGCRSPRDHQHWSPDCEVLACCVDQKKLSFCSECTDFPCDLLLKWVAEIEHHKSAIDRLKEMKTEGTHRWLEKNGYTK